jgi:acetoin utilization deacetylase AcuC-like enzyme
MTVLITHPACFEHINPEGAPEQVARLRFVLDALSDMDLPQLEAPKARRDQLLLCHDPAYVDSIPGRIPAKGNAWLDEDTYVSSTSLEAIYRAVGGAIRAVDAILDGEAKNVFVATRPPGHHAETAIPMGFCIFGNIALAAKHALEIRGLSRVAVLDFDVHHGNGTEALLRDDPRALFVSSHQMPLWPGTGEADETGPHDSVINIPLPPGSDGAYALNAWEPVWARLKEHKPEMIFISAGFDAHKDDPLAALNWTAADFADFTQKICDLAAELCEGRLVSLLEGGYDLDALGASARAHVEILQKAAQK